VGLDGGADVCLSRAVSFALEPRRAVAPGGTACTTGCHWGWRTVVTRRLVIGPFELLFDRLNMNSTV
jgi:hypothetical protein